MEIIGIALVFYSLLGAWYLWSEIKLIKAEKRQADWIVKQDNITQFKIDELTNKAKSCTTFNGVDIDLDTKNVNNVFTHCK